MKHAIHIGRRFAPWWLTRTQISIFSVPTISMPWSNSPISEKNSLSIANAEPIITGVRSGAVRLSLRRSNSLSGISILQFFRIRSQKCFTKFNVEMKLFTQSISNPNRNQKLLSSFACRPYSWLKCYQYVAPLTPIGRLRFGLAMAPTNPQCIQYANPKIPKLYPSEKSK